MDLKIRIVDNFFWLLVTDNFGKLYGKYELYELHSDGSESLLDSLCSCYVAIQNGNDIGIELGNHFIFKNKILNVNRLIEKELLEMNTDITKKDLL